MRLARSPGLGQQPLDDLVAVGDDDEAPSLGCCRRGPFVDNSLPSADTSFRGPLMNPRFMPWLPSSRIERVARDHVLPACVQYNDDVASGVSSAVSGAEESGYSEPLNVNRIVLRLPATSVKECVPTTVNALVPPSVMPT